MSKVFNRVGGLKPRRNVFDLSFRKNFTGDMGKLYPVLLQECVPGDHFTFGNNTTVRLQPMFYPIMHEVTATVHYFFVPYRILWEHWEDYISQGNLNPDTLDLYVPRHDPNQQDWLRLGSLWDYFGFPIISQYEWDQQNLPTPPQKCMPLRFPWLAYNRIWNEYYRDQNLQSKVGLDGDPENTSSLNYDVLSRNWKKDYFTAALPFQQKGTPPALPVNIDITSESGFVPIGLRSNNSGNIYSPALQFSSYYPGRYFNVAGDQNVFGNGFSMVVPESSPVPSGGSVTGGLLGTDASLIGASLKANTTTFDVSDLRLAFQCQKWLERNARGGTRYTEFLRSHFGVSPTDARLDRPEYIGGTKVPIIVNEVLQTSPADGTRGVVGSMAGHGLAADGQYAGKYYVQEYGLIMALLSIMPKPAYQNGINRQWLRFLPTDFYFPEFAHLSEQAIDRSEVAWNARYIEPSDHLDPETDPQIFGFIPQYDEMRINHDEVCAQMRRIVDRSTVTGFAPTQFQWNMARTFDVFNDSPNLNSEFITCDPKKDIFAVQGQDTLIINVQHLIKAVRPIPLLGEPGLIDHN